MKTSIIGYAAGLLLSASVAIAAPAGQGERKDFQVAKDIATSVQRYTQFTIFDDVNAYVKDGVRTATRNGTIRYKRDEIEKRIARVDGVRRVNDQITVLPVSQF